MKLAKVLATAAAVSFAAAPALAAPAANPAASLSISKSVRAGTATTKDSKLAGSGLIVAIIAAAP